MANEFIIPETLIVGSKAAFGELERLTTDVANEIEAVSNLGDATIGIFTGAASVGSYNFGVTSTGVDAAANIEYDHSSKQMRFRLDGTIVGTPGPTEITIDASGGTTITTVTADLTVGGAATITETVIVGGGIAVGEITRLPASIANEIEAVSNLGDATIGIFTGAASVGSYNFGVTSTGVDAAANIEYDHSSKQMRFRLDGTIVGTPGPTEITIDASGGTTITTIAAVMVVGERAAFGEVGRSAASIVNEIEAVNDAGNASIGIFTSNTSIGSYNFGTGITAASANIDYNHSTNLMRLVIDGTPELSIDASGVTTVTTIAADMVVTGNLTVNGTTTTVSSTNLVITDNIILLNKDEVGAGVTLGIAGIEIERGPITDNAGWFYNEAKDWWGPTGPNGILGVGGATQVIGNITTIDSTGDANNVLTINANGAIKIPAGDTAARPIPPINGMVRYSSTFNNLEGYISGNWEQLLNTGSSVTMNGDLTMGAGAQIFIDDGTLANPGLAFSDDGNTGIYSGAGDSNFVGLVANGSELLRIGPTEITAFATLDMNNNILSGVSNPVAGDQVGDRDFNDGRYVEVAGDTMAGTLNMNNNALTNPLNPVDATGVGDREFNDNRYVNKTGDTMTGVLNMSGASADIVMAGGSISSPADPLTGIQVGDRDFNDARYLLEANNLSDLTNVATARTNLGIVAGGAGDIWVEKAGDTMTGDLIMAADILPDTTGNLRDVGSTTQRFQAMWATTFNGTATAALYSDLAERYAADMDLEPGTVVVFGGEAEITMSSLTEDTAVAGVISTAPAFMMNSEAGEDKTHPYVALKGRVPCKVTGPIKKGDLLITATLRGHAMSVGKRARSYTAFARALENFNGGTGVIEVAII